MRARHRLTSTALLVAALLAGAGCAVSGAPSTDVSTEGSALESDVTRAVFSGDGAAYRIARGPSIVVRLSDAATGLGSRRIVLDASTCDAREERLPDRVRVVLERCRLDAGSSDDELVRDVTSASARLDFTVAEPGTVDVTPTVLSLPPGLGVDDLGVQVTFADDVPGSHVFIPAFTGYELDDPAINLPPDPIDLNHGESLQATAFYHDDGSGILMFAVDPRGTEPKRFEYARARVPARGTEIAISWNVADPHVTGRQVTTPFAFRFRPLVRDWYDAAQFYRAWVESTGPDGILRRGKLAERTDVPRWFVDTDLLVVDNIAWYPTDQAPSARIRRHRDLAAHVGASESVLGLWGWFDEVGDPEAGLGGYLPWPGLAADIAWLSERGMRSLGYTRFAQFSPRHSAAPSLLAYMCNDRAGAVTTDGHDYNADLASSFWVGYCRNFAQRMRDDTGLAGLYHDAVAGVPADFVRPEGGPLGRTAGYYEGIGNIASALRSETPEGIASIYESAHEWLIADTSGAGATGHWLRVVPGDATSRAVPFYATVYHDYDLHWLADDSFGPRNLGEVHGWDPARLARVLARGFTLGSQLNTSESQLGGDVPLHMWTPEYVAARFTLDDATARWFIERRDHYYAFLRDAIAARRSARDFLVFGRLLRDPWIAGDREEITLNVIYDETREVREVYDERKVYVTAWEAPDGRHALVAANPSTSAGSARVDARIAGVEPSMLVDDRSGISFPVTAGVADLVLEPGQILVLRSVP